MIINDTDKAKKVKCCSSKQVPNKEKYIWATLRPDSPVESYSQWLLERIEELNDEITNSKGASIHISNLQKVRLYCSQETIGKVK